MCKRLTVLLLGWGAIALIAATTSAATYDIRVATNIDDIEERVPDGSMDGGSSDIEMPYENAGTPPTNPQYAGFRWPLPLAKGTKISKAYVEFECDETKGGTLPVNLVIEGQLTPNAPIFTTTAKDITNRTPRTVAKVQWAFPNWTAADQKAQTSDLTAILTELIRQDGWASGNAIVLIFSDDASNPSTGVRCVESFEGEATAAALLHVEVFDPLPSKPDPANGAQEVTSPLLQWTAGDGAIAHQVYIGTKPALGAAEAAGGPIPMTMYFHVAGFIPGTTYYWRVDETAADGTVTTGPIWSFQAMPVAAWSPSPADNGVWLRNDTKVSWKAGQGAASHKVYGGTDKAAVAAGDASVLLGTQAETSFALAGLKSLTVYYWRVDEVDATGTVVPGPVWTINVAGANTGSWKTAAAAAEPNYIATYVADGLYDIGAFGDEQTYEFIVRSNPEEQEASMCLIGRRQFGDTTVGLKYEQWNNTKHYGATVFGVKDYDFGVANAPGEYTHLVFVSSKAGAKTDLYVNGELKGSVATAISLSGKVGIGDGAQGADGSGVFDNFDGSIFGVAIYNKALSADVIAANSAAFLATWKYMV
ncbi:MAG: LamG domain-containing protein, partial [Planctomycetes bacterium]|nr:LamG domain-containing protein [Planctomycetota bacterium]